MGSKLLEYLERSKNAILKNSDEKSSYEIVIGNESCDLDSVISCIAYSFYLFLRNRDDTKVISPVMNLKKRDFILRTEVNFFLNQFGINENILIFRDEVNLLKISEKSKFSLHLVDHNVLSFEDFELEKFVVSIFDHHVLQRQNLPELCCVEAVGSCATLITHEFMRNLTPTTYMQNDLAFLLHGTILFDTINFDQNAKRGTAKDLKAVEFLENFLKLSKVLESRAEIFGKLTVAKSSVKHLSIGEIFRKDLKIVSVGAKNIAFASIPFLVQEYISKPKAVELILQEAKNFNSIAVVLMGLELKNIPGTGKTFPNKTSLQVENFFQHVGKTESPEPNSKLEFVSSSVAYPDVETTKLEFSGPKNEKNSIFRDLAVVSEDCSIVSKLSEFLEKVENSALDLRKMEELSSKNCLIFRQKNVTKSRKFVLPCVLNWLENDNK